MLKWCSYCQQFMREIAPYDDFSITHGLCARCELTCKDPFATNEVERAGFLSGIFHALFEAGRRGDFDAAAQIVDEAIAANCRPVDILIGMISPMLYEIGEEWKRGALSVEAEHRFTAFCEDVVVLLESRVGASNAAPARPSKATLLFLMNAPGNQHSLAVRILALWLESRGAKVRIVDDDIDTGSLMRSIAADRPKSLLISMAVTEQRDRVAEIAEAAQTLPRSVRPKIIVGGYPIKAGLVRSIPAVELVSDISTLEFA
jgi:methanogenic corrinoid protein MtbC1